MWNAELDSDENFTFLFDYDEWNNGSRTDYRTYAIYDNNGIQEYRWSPPRLYFNRYAFLKHMITKENQVVLTLTPENLNWRPGQDLIKIIDDKTIKWRKFQDFAFVNVGILDISESPDQKILLAGFSDSPDQGGHIRLSLIHI